LDFDCTAQGVNNARELNQNPIACGLNNPSTVFTDLGVNDRSAMLL
jgi:hypothetical protein